MLGAFHVPVFFGEFLFLASKSLLGVHFARQLFLKRVSHVFQLLAAELQLLLEPGDLIEIVKKRFLCKYHRCI